MHHLKSLFVAMGKRLSRFFTERLYHRSVAGWHRLKVNGARELAGALRSPAVPFGPARATAGTQARLARKFMLGVGCMSASRPTAWGESNEHTICRKIRMDASGAYSHRYRRFGSGSQQDV